MSENHKPNQCQRVLDYIDKHGGITQHQATKHISVQRLASRISELKKQGYPITDEWVRGVNKYGEKWRAKRYSMEEQNEIPESGEPGRT